MGEKINLRKGGNVNLSKEFSGVTHFKVGLHWNFKDGKVFDLDAMAIMLNDRVENGGKVIDMGHVVAYFNNDPSRSDFDKVTFRNPDGSIGFKSSDDAVKSKGDCRDGKAAGEDEEIEFDLDKVDSRVKSILVLMSIYDLDNNGYCFGMVNGAGCSLYVGNAETAEISCDLTEDMSSGRTLEFVEFYRHNGEWKYKYIGELGSDKIDEELRKFGIPC